MDAYGDIRLSTPHGVRAILRETVRNMARHGHDGPCGVFRVASSLAVYGFAGTTELAVYENVAEALAVYQIERVMYTARVSVPRSTP